MAGAAIPALGRILGSLGGASGGISKLTSATEKLNQVGNAVYSIQAISGAVKSLGNSALSSVSPLSHINKAFETLTGALGTAFTHVTALGRAVEPFTKLASPASSKFFEFAQEDALASAGKALLPVMEFATQLTRAFADVLFRLAGPMQKLMGAFFDPLSNLLPKLVTAMTPLLNLVNRFVDQMAAMAKPFMDIASAGLEAVFLGMEVAFDALNTVVGPAADGIKLLAQVVGELTGAVASAVSAFVKDIRGLLGLSDSAAGGSVNAAAPRNARMESIDSFVKKAFETAYGSQGNLKPEERSANTLDQILQWLNKLSWAEIARAIADAIKGVLPGAETVTDAAVKAGRFVEEKKTAVARRADAALEGDFLGALRGADGSLPWE